MPPFPSCTQIRPTQARCSFLIRDLSSRTDEWILFVHTFHKRQREELPCVAMISMRARVDSMVLFASIQNRYGAKLAFGHLFMPLHASIVQGKDDASPRWHPNFIKRIKWTFWSSRTALESEILRWRLPFSLHSAVKWAFVEVLCVLRCWIVWRAIRLMRPTRRWQPGAMTHNRLF